MNKENKTVVYYSDAGSGHKQAANRIKSFLNKNGIEVNIINMTSLDANMRFCEKSYNLFLKKGWPGYIFNLYLIFGQTCLWLYDRFIYDYKSFYKNIILKEFNSGSKNIIINFPVASNMLIRSFCDIKEENDYNLIISVLDTKNPKMPWPFKFWNAFYFTKETVKMANINRKVYFMAPTEEVKADLIKLGLNPNQLLDIKGFPLPEDKENLINDKQKDKQNVCISFGSVGSCLTFKVFDSILRNNNDDIVWHIVCGKDEETRSKLDNKLKKINIKNVKVYGFVDLYEMQKTMDFYIGKPGATTLIECIANRLPFLSINNLSVMKQERDTADYITNNKIGKIFKSYDEIIKYLCGSPVKESNEYKKWKETLAVMSEEFRRHNESFLRFIKK